MNLEEVNTYLQSRYDDNSKKCKSLHLQWEMIEAELSYHREQFNIEKSTQLELKLIGVKGQLNSLWNKQVDLYAEINKQK